MDNLEQIQIEDCCETFKNFKSFSLYKTLNKMGVLGTLVSDQIAYNASFVLNIMYDCGLFEKYSVANLSGLEKLTKNNEVVLTTRVPLFKPPKNISCGPKFMPKDAFTKFLELIGIHSDDVVEGSLLAINVCRLRKYIIDSNYSISSLPNSIYEDDFKYFYAPAFTFLIKELQPALQYLECVAFESSTFFPAQHKFEYLENDVHIEKVLGSRIDFGVISEKMSKLIKEWRNLKDESSRGNFKLLTCSHFLKNISELLSYFVTIITEKSKEIAKKMKEEDNESSNSLTDEDMMFLKTNFDMGLCGGFKFLADLLSNQLEPEQDKYIEKGPLDKGFMFSRSISGKTEITANEQDLIVCSVIKPFEDSAKNNFLYFPRISP